MPSLALIVMDIASGARGRGKNWISGLVKSNTVLLLPVARHCCNVLSLSPGVKSRELHTTTSTIKILFDKAHSIRGLYLIIKN